MTFAVAAAAFQAVSAISSYQQGRAAEANYKFQAESERIKAQISSVEGERKFIQYQQRANDILRRRNSTNATLAARAFAGGVDAFSGSPDIVAAMNNTAAGREYAILLQDADAAFRAGELQARLYDVSAAGMDAAGRQAKRTGTFNAIAKLGAAAVGYGDKTGLGTQSPSEIRNAEVFRG